MTLKEAISDIQGKLKKGLLPNEAAVSQGAVLPVLNALGWPVFNNIVVCPQYTVGGGRVDYALCRPNGKPMVFVEVKRVGIAKTGERQLFEYAYHQGVPIAVLTDGQEWTFYHPTGEGTFQERLVYQLDILERELSESFFRLTRYLSYEDVLSDTAIERAKQDCVEVSRDREVRKAFPEVWAKLVEEADDSLVELLADKVAVLCGIVPSPESCANFLSSLGGTVHPALGSNATAIPSTSTQEINAGQSESVLPPHASPSAIQMGYELQEKQRDCSTAVEVMTQVFEELSSIDSTLLERFASRKHGTKRRYIAQDQYELYPGRPEFCERNFRKLNSGWFLGTYYGKDGINKILQLACEVAGLEFGIDLVVTLS